MRWLGVAARDFRIAALRYGQQKAMMLTRQHRSD
jgi:hypothetical protein